MEPEPQQAQVRSWRLNVHKRAVTEALALSLLAKLVVVAEENALKPAGVGMPGFKEVEYNSKLRCFPSLQRGTDELLTVNGGMGPLATVTDNNNDNAKKVSPHSDFDVPKPSIRI